ncbi:antibiotic biosynthesis monooxygenase family protein [Streptomyces sparsogenes]|uniref:antibiotic biosynthesis monooxygenase family protein n=1 Tax=Streptomyces sparsogenes TaxID=67365 RepID=UPI00331C2D7A
MDEKESVTFINVIELPADEVDTFVEQWRERAKLMRDAPGFQDSRLHRAKLPDARFQLVNVAHWDSTEAWEAATANPAFRSAVRGVSDAVTPNPALYDVVVEYHQP